MAAKYDTHWIHKMIRTYTEPLQNQLKNLLKFNAVV